MVSRFQPWVKLAIRFPFLSATISLEHLGSHDFVARFWVLHGGPSSAAVSEIPDLRPSTRPHGLRGLILPDTLWCCPTPTRLATATPPYCLLTLPLLTPRASVPPSRQAFTRTLGPIWFPGTGVLSSLPFHRRITAPLILLTLPFVRRMLSGVDVD